MESFFEKAKKAIGGFFKGALAALPHTLLLTGAIYGGLYAVGATTGFDPLSVTGADGGLVKRIMMSTAIGLGVSGVITGYQEAMAPSTSGLPAAAPVQSGKPERGNEQSVSQDISPPGFTPPIQAGAKPVLPTMQR